MNSGKAALWLSTTCFILAAGRSALYAQEAAVAPQTAVATEAAPQPAERELTEEEKEARDLTSAVNRFALEAAEFRKEVQFIIEKKYKDRHDSIRSRFEQELQELEKEERARRLDAIARFEEFLKKYPDAPNYTPHAIYRLAELHFEQSKDDFDQQQKKFDRDIALFQDGKLKTEPVAPLQNYSKTIELEQRLISDFENMGGVSFEHFDGAYYILAYCLGEQGEGEDAIATYHKLVEKYPSSKFVPEVWMRIGEYHFDTGGTEELTLAIAAYQKAIQFADHTLYDKALYKLAWTYYRLDDFDNAVTYFTGVLDYYEKLPPEQREKGATLRQEAIDYIAISCTEEGWPRAGLENLVAYFNAIGGRTYETEVVRKLGKVYFDIAKHAEAAKAYRIAIEKSPLAEWGPELQAQIVRAHEILKDMEGATREREVMVKSFSPDGEWWEANKEKPDALKTAEQLTQQALYTAAIFHHQQAQVYRQSGKEEQARNEYELAAISYQGFLNRYPDHPNAYELNFYYADSLFYAGRLEDAAAQYSMVRDSPAGKDHLAEAAYDAVLAYKMIVEQQERAGDIPKLGVEGSEQRKGKSVEPVEIAGIRKRFIEASDAFVAKLPQDPKAAEVAYTAALIFYSHNYFDEARNRFDAIIQGYPNDKVAEWSANYVLETRLIESDWKSVIETIDRLKPVISSGERRQEMDKIKSGGRFKLAEQLDKEGKYEEAALAYLAMVKEAPTNEFADVALFNAARDFAQVQKFDTATKINERLVEEYPKSNLADKALFQLASNAEKSYDFEKAISNYLKLVESYPQSPNRQASLYNAALALEDMQEYPRAAEAFSRYCELFPEAENAAETYYRVALVWEKAGDIDKMIEMFEKFNKKYGTDIAHSEKVVEGTMKTAEAYAKAGNKRKEKEYYERTMAEFNRRGLTSKSRASEFAAKADYKLAEMKFEEFDEIKFVGKLDQQLKKKAESRKNLMADYKRVFDYKRINWTLCALYRLGNIEERFASDLYNSPCPKGLNEEECDIYKVKLEELARPIEDRAIEALEKALTEAHSAKVVNECVEAMVESLHKFKPSAFPLERKPVYSYEDSENTSKWIEQSVSPESAPQTKLILEQPAPPQPEASPAEAQQEQPTETLPPSEGEGTKLGP